MEELPGNVVVNDLDRIISKTKVPIELSSTSWNTFIVGWMKLYMSNSTLKVNTVNVMQYYSRSWRERLPHLHVSSSLPLYVGSYAEGMSNSEDCDVMYIAKWLYLYEFDGPFRKDGLPMTPYDCPPGYVRIITPAFMRPRDDPQFRKHGRYHYLTNSGYLEVLQDWGATGSTSLIHGPAMRSTIGFSHDMVHAIRCENWPSFAVDFFRRKRKHSVHLDRIRTMETYVVATSKTNSKFPGLEWRLSFTNAEKFLVESWGNTEKYCYFLLKQFKCYYLPDQDIVSSYYMKTVMFWMCEALPREFWREENLMKGYTLAMSILIHFLLKCEIPNFFIPENNMIDHKDKDECRKIGKYIEEKLYSGQMNVTLIESLNEYPIKFVFEDSGRHFNVCRPIRSNKIFQDCITRYYCIDPSLKQRVLEEEACLLSSLSTTIALWNQEQFESMLDTLQNLQYNVSKELITPFSLVIKRKLGDHLHKVGLRSSLQKAEVLYKEALNIVYPSGFSDNGVSGTTHLAFFYYLNSQFDQAVGLLSTILPIIKKAIDSHEVECYLTEVIPIYKADRFWGDSVLYTAVKNTKPETPIKVNSIVLACYIYIRCICAPERTINAQENSSLFEIYSKFVTLAEDLLQKDSLESFNLLREGLIPIIIKRLDVL